MDSNTIEKLLLKDPRTQLLFRGVYSSDTLPPDAKEGLYIVREAKSHDPGTHWISLHITSKKRKKCLLRQLQSKTHPERDQKFPRTQVRLQQEDGSTHAIH